MRLGAIPENPVEWAAQAAGLVPTPVIDTLVALLLARAVMVGTQVGVFEALAAGPLVADEIAPVAAGWRRRRRRSCSTASPAPATCATGRAAMPLPRSPANGC
jgi:hypothetical protein